MVALRWASWRHWPTTPPCATGSASSITWPIAAVLWIAESDGTIIGSVQLDRCGKENGRYRAEVQKLLVHSAFRGRGVATLLMRTVEEFARADDRTLLVLDTQAGSAAEAVYRHLGWQSAGQIPNYATTPHGVLHATVYFYKQLTA